MGAAIARSLRTAGHDVVVWNRSPKDLGEIGLADAPLTADPAGAVRDADAVIVCVRDHHASRELLERLAPGLTAGVPVVNVSTGTPEDAVASADAAAALGIAYVTGAIMVPTALVGTEHHLVLCAGGQDAVAAARPVLAGLGGVTDVLGEDHAVPPALDLAMLDVFFAGMYAFLHSAALVRAHGIEPSAYLPYATGILETLGAELPNLAQAFELRKYDRGQASLEMCLRGLEHVVAATEAAGVAPALPRLVRDVTRAQMERAKPGVDWESVAEGLTDPAR
ncbi:3-hydroxyisobutyrate dehydrogenase-like beta-hydroxyacid dehydrogenase [Nocardioides thalensis]|uniref:3-hydroxyisobutyrate dehydrogenase-like beta-hydroxyacid dehydrogenase n=2 Tax=Nocardioides thalensis TaxID=1914755 RepID=A0A853BZF1_9ACTN|nr:3-hydroxyisobutyrate dehydrogenase-like beta-hydroxyacid dehydrogenase [Nocardioides thalensis]